MRYALIEWFPVGRKPCCGEAFMDLVSNAKVLEWNCSFNYWFASQNPKSGNILKLQPVFKDWWFRKAMERIMFNNVKRGVRLKCFSQQKTFFLPKNINIFKQFLDPILCQFPYRPKHSLMLLSCFTYTFI